MNRALSSYTSEEYAELKHRIRERVAGLSGLS